MDKSANSMSMLFRCCCCCYAIFYINTQNLLQRVKISRKRRTTSNTRILRLTLKPELTRCHLSVSVSIQSERHSFSPTSITNENSWNNRFLLRACVAGDRYLSLPAHNSHTSRYPDDRQTLALSSACDADDRVAGGNPCVSSVPWCLAVLVCLLVA